VGLSCVIGVQRTLKFFFQRQKIKASLSFFGGISVVLFGWPIVGMLFEIYGFILLFRSVISSFGFASHNILHLVFYSNNLITFTI